MADKNPNTIEVQGITITINPQILEDWEVVECMGDVNDPTLDDAAHLSATTRVMRLILGEDYQRIKKELREKNKGVLNIETMTNFLTETLEVLQAKNF